MEEELKEGWGMKNLLTLPRFIHKSCYVNWNEEEKTRRLK